MYKFYKFNNDIKRILPPSIAMSKHERACIVDELMAPIIQLLNIKGWKTLECCSGHLRISANDDKDRCYIKFKGSLCELKEHGFIIPSYFKVIEHPDFTEIYRSFHADMDRYEQILDACKTLYLWSRFLGVSI